MGHYRNCIASYWHSLETGRPIGVCVLVIAAYNLVQFFDLEARECFDVLSEMTHFELCPTNLRLSSFYMTFYKGFLYGFFMALFPISLLSILTVYIVVQLHRSKKKHYSDPNGILKIKKGFSDHESNSSSPLVLVLVIALFLACNITSLYVNIADIFPQ